MDIIRNYTDAMRQALYNAQYSELSTLQIAFGEFPDNVLSGTNFPTVAGLDAGAYTAKVVRLSEEDAIFYINQTDNDTSAYAILPIDRIYQISNTQQSLGGSVSIEMICESGSFAQRLVAYCLQQSSGLALDGLVGIPANTPFDDKSYFSQSSDGSTYYVTAYSGAYFAPIYTSDINNWSPPL